MKKIRTLLSIALSIILLLQSISVSAASNGSVTFSLNDNETTEASFMMDSSADEESIKDAEVLFELTDNRSAYTKEFLLSNGLHMAVAYPDQVHYEKNGKWKDIDNTLKLVDGKYTNAEGIFKASNKFTYCGNNPISREDKSGEWFWIAIGAVIGAAVGFVSSVVEQTISGNEINWGVAAVAAGAGALSGALVSVKTVVWIFSIQSQKSL